MKPAEIREHIVAGIHLERRSPLPWGATKGAVCYRPAAWLGRPLTPSERVQFCRELERMAREGLVERIGYAGTRTSSVRLLRQPG